MAFLPKFCHDASKRFAPQLRRVGTTPKHTPTKCGGWGNVRACCWRGCLSWRCARAPSVMLFAAWIIAVLVFDPFFSHDFATSDKGLQMKVHDFKAAMTVGPPGICGRIADVAPYRTSSAWFPTSGRARTIQQQEPQEACIDGSSGAQRAALLVVLVIKDADASAACARGAVAARNLKIQQTLACFDVAFLVLDQKPGGRAGAEHLSCPGLRSLNAEHMFSRDFVMFVAVRKDEVDRLQPAALEKLVLAAHYQDADVVTMAHHAVHDDISSSGGNNDGEPKNTVCIEKRWEEDEKAGHPGRRSSIICRGASAPVLLRVPQWLSAPQLEIWTAAIAGTIRAARPSAGPSTQSSRKIHTPDDGLAGLFCVGGQEKNMTTHVLRERQSPPVIYHQHAPKQTGVKGSPVDTMRRWCGRVDNITVKQPTTASSERQLSEIHEKKVIADAYVARTHINISGAAPPPDARRLTGLLKNGSSTSASATTTVPGFMLVVPWLEHGGADQFNVNLARELTRLGIRVVVVTTLSSTHPTAPDFYAITPDIFHLPHLVTSPRDTTRVLDVLTYLVASRGVEVVMISHSALGYELLPSFRRAVEAAGEQRVVKFVDYVHLEEIEWGNGGYAATSVAHAQHLDHTFAASRHVVAWMRSRAGGGVGGLSAPLDSSSRVSVAYIGVDTQSLRPMSPGARLVARHELFQKHASSVPVIVYLARMVDQKLPELYFEIIRQLLEERRVEFASVAIGGGPKLEELRANLSRLSSAVDRSDSHRQQAPHVALGMLDHGAAVRVLAASDILLLPSKNEGIALAAYEAMALGVTPVVSAVGGQCELVSSGAGACVSLERGRGGLLSNQNGPLSPDSLAEAATAFVDELELLITSPNLLNRRRRDARRRVDDEFDMHHTVRALARGLQCTGV